MREILVFVVLCVVAVQIQSKSLYRNGRDLKLNEVPAEQLRQIPVVVIQEEVLLPVQTLQNIEPVAEVEEPGVLLIENNVRRKDDLIVEGEGESYQEEHFPVVAAEDADEPNKENLIAVEQTNEDLPPVQTILKQGGSSTIRPSLIEQAQQIINNNPFSQFVDSIRRPVTKAPEGDQAAIEATTNANLLQQFQAGVQNIGSQLTSAFIPGQSNLQASASNPAETVVRPPNFLEQLQTNFQNTVQGIFRPNTDQIANPPQGPLQAVLTNVQNFLAGNRGEVSTTQVAASDTQLLVDDKVDSIVGQASEPVAVAVEPEHPLETANNAENDAVVLVESDSSLENESK